MSTLVVAAHALITVELTKQVNVFKSIYPPTFTDQLRVIAIV